MKHHPKLLAQYAESSIDPALDPLTRRIFDMIFKQLESPNCKRMLFDAKQAKVFDTSGPIDETKRTKIRAPFPFLYLEFNDTILTEAQEPGYKDVLCGLLYHEAFGTATEVMNGGKDRREAQVTKVTFFQRGANDEVFTDRTWSVSPEGYPLVGRMPGFASDRYGKNQRTFSGGVLSASGLTNQDLLPDYVKEGELISVFELSRLGWWEENIISHINLLYWIFAYTMAKSVERIEIPPSRQLVRAAMRKEEKIPEPYHIVKVNPIRIKGKPEVVGESGVKHSYRYDVIGHLRFNRHVTKEGYKDTIEWVPSHQRGLENALYIPKTYQVEADKKIAMPEMQEYFE